MTPRILVYFIHADPRVREQYDRALVDYDHELVFVNRPGLSSAYEALAASLRTHGRILPKLREFYPAKARADITLLCSFSAGYKLVQRILEIPADRDELDGWVGLDSLHSGFDGDGTPSDLQLEPFVDLARLARDGRKVCWIGHSDVRTSGYASTTQTAAEVERLAGPQEKLFHVEAHDTRPASEAADEHRQALIGWGAGFLADAVADLLEARGAGRHDTDPPESPPTVPSRRELDFGRALLAAAEEDLDAGIREIGHNAGADIERLYLDPMGLAPGQSYCAAAVSSWIRRAAASTGRKPPIPGSAGAKAMGEQFKAAGLWTPRGPALREALRPGSVLVFDRSGGDPHQAWKGHVAVVHTMGDEVAYCIEANADRPPPCDAVCMTERRLDDPTMLGAGRFV